MDPGSRRPSNSTHLIQSPGPQPDNFRTGYGHLRGIRDRQADDPENPAAGIGHQGDMGPLPPGNFPVYKNVMHFLRAAQTQRRNFVSLLPGPDHQFRPDCRGVEEDFPDLPPIIAGKDDRSTTSAERAMPK